MNRCGWVVASLLGHTRHVGWISWSEETAMWVLRPFDGNVLEFPRGSVHTLEWLENEEEAKQKAGVEEEPEPVFVASDNELFEHLRECKAESDRLVESLESKRDETDLEAFREDLARCLGIRVPDSAIEIIRNPEWPYERKARVTVGRLQILTEKAVVYKDAFWDGKDIGEFSGPVELLELLEVAGVLAPAEASR